TPTPGRAALRGPRPRAARGRARSRRARFRVDPACAQGRVPRGAALQGRDVRRDGGVRSRPPATRAAREPLERDLVRRHRRHRRRRPAELQPLDRRRAARLEPRDRRGEARQRLELLALRQLRSRPRARTADALRSRGGEHAPRARRLRVPARAALPPRARGSRGSAARARPAHGLQPARAARQPGEPEPPAERSGDAGGGAVPGRRTGRARALRLRRPRLRLRRGHALRPIPGARGRGRTGHRAHLHAARLRAPGMPAGGPRRRRSGGERRAPRGPLRGTREGTAARRRVPERGPRAAPPRARVRSTRGAEQGSRCARRRARGERAGAPFPPRSRVMSTLGIREDFLAEMARASLERVRHLADRTARPELERRALAAPAPPALRLEASGFDLLAEVKFVSPAAGALASSPSAQDAVDRARRYAGGGAAALSVLTEPSRFAGELEHLSAVARSVALPVLRKDFLVDPLQLHEARLAGASGVLLVLRMLEERVLADMLAASRAHGLFVLLEAFDEADLERA